MAVLVHDSNSLKRRFLFDTLWRTGGKISEVLALRASDFQLSGGEEMVYFGGKKTGRAVEIEEPRYLRLVSEFIHQHEDHADVPLMSISRQTASNWLSRRVDEVREQDPDVLPDGAISFNTFRNSFAFHAMLNAVPLDTLQRWLGHNQAQMTRRYMRYLGHDSRQHMERMSH